MRYVSNRIGSRKSQTTVYWTSKDDIQVVCGCFKSNLDDFEVRVNKVHANNPQYLKEYLKLIEVVKYLVNVEY